MPPAEQHTTLYAMVQLFGMVGGAWWYGAALQPQKSENRKVVSNKPVQQQNALKNVNIFAEHFEIVQFEQDNIKSF